MSDPTIVGGCLCGAVRSRAALEPAAVTLCHCDDCQRQSGAAYSINVLVGPRPDHRGRDAMKIFDTIGADTGEPRQRRFCGTCGSPIITELAEMEGMVAIKAGTLDDRSWLEPEMALWCDRFKHPWLSADVELGEFATGLLTERASAGEQAGHALGVGRHWRTSSCAANPRSPDTMARACALLEPARGRVASKPPNLVVALEDAEALARGRSRPWSAGD